VRIDPDACTDPVLLAAEVRRLQAVIAASDTLTDAEREAIEYAAVVGRVASELDREVLKGLLKRNGSPDGCETVQ
jgi:hypothetical protein